MRKNSNQEKSPQQKSLPLQDEILPFILPNTEVVVFRAWGWGEACTLTIFMRFLGSTGAPGSANESGMPLW